MARRTQLHDAASLLEALAQGAPVQLVLHRAEELSEPARLALDRAAAAGVELRPLSRNQLTRLCQARVEPELLALVGADPRRDLEPVLEDAHTVWLLVDTAYPGNAGFVIRTAEVSGADAVVIGAAFDHEQRRAVRRTAMRADRYMPLFYADAAETLETAHAAGLECIGIEDPGSTTSRAARCSSWAGNETASRRRSSRVATRSCGCPCRGSYPPTTCRPPCRWSPESAGASDSQPTPDGRTA